MIRDLQVRLFDLATCLSDALDLISPMLVNHHKQVAYAAFNIGMELGLSPEQRYELIMAGMLHDVGALSLKERMNTLNFEFQHPYKHAEIGYALLKKFQPLSKVATLVRYHHVPWEGGKGSQFMEQSVPLGSHILHLADRLAVLMRKDQEPIGQADEICNTLREHSGKMFMPDLVDALMKLASRAHFWLDIASPSITLILSRQMSSGLPTIELNLDELLNLANLFSHVIDFRSSFTATHSSGVATIAEWLAKFIGFSEGECKMMKIAGYLHDLGKLAVPTEILEKPTKLTEDEFNIIKSHTYYTYRVLENIEELDTINMWASFHHERLDGSGYPFGIKGDDMPLGSRIMAVADVFTAITEDRPYRKGMAPERALKILKQMADNSALDSNVVSVLEVHIDEVNFARMSAQNAATEEYRSFKDNLMGGAP